MMNFYGFPDPASVPVIDGCDELELSQIMQ